MKKVRNFQEEFSIEDIDIARDVRRTYDCGMSRIALKAPEQIYRVYRDIIKEPDSVAATIRAITLKLHYAIQVWCKAALISTKNPSDLIYYWWLRWKSDENPFNKLEYSNFYSDITVDQLLRWFWELLEQIANSGEIQVSEGYWINCEGEGDNGPKVECELVVDADSGGEISNKVKNIYTYQYNKELKTYKWEEIKGFFYEMTLDQLRLTMPNHLHNHKGMDDVLLKASADWDVEMIKLALKRGANINCLDKWGESVLQKAVGYYKEHNIYFDKEYTKDERKSIEAENEKKCKEIVELLLSYGADINLFGSDGMTPLTCAYYQHSPEMIKFLLDRGASPNANCYLTDIEYWPKLKNIRSTVLDLIYESLCDEYDDVEHEMERLIRDAGGRQFVWDYTPWNDGNINKYVVWMIASNNDDKIFCDNAGWKIGSIEVLTIEDREGNQSAINLEGVKGLKQWNSDFRDNINNLDYDWRSWKERGYKLAVQVAKLLPDEVALFYLYDNDIRVEDYRDANTFFICRAIEPIRIK